MTKQHPIVSKSEWLNARKELLAKEKAFSKQRDEMSARRRALPWVKVDKSYVFQDDSGSLDLAELFGDSSQLVIYHFMFHPEWEAGCKSCSFWADHFDGMQPHLRARDVSFAVVSRAGLPKLRAYAKRLGWSFRWVSSAQSDFNYDFGVSFTKEQIDSGEPLYNVGTMKAFSEEAPGLSVFYKDEEGQIFHTYSTYARGLDQLNPAYQHLDLVPKGRDEAELKYTMAWLRIHDEYEA